MRLYCLLAGRAIDLPTQLATVSHVARLIEGELSGCHSDAVMHIGLVFDLRTDVLPPIDAPDDFLIELDSEETILLLQEGLERQGHTVRRVGNARRLLELATRGFEVDLVFNVAEGHGGPEREAQVPLILEIFGIPYTFSDPATMMVCHDKSLAKHVWQAAGLPTPDFRVLRDIDNTEQQLGDLMERFPLFVKPVHEGTSKGIDTDSLVREPRDLKERVSFVLSNYDQPALVEEWLPGREFTVGIVGTPPGASVLGITEIRLVDGSPVEIYGWRQKEESESRIEYRPVSDPLLIDHLGTMALAAYGLMGCRDAGRLDIRLDHRDSPHLLEVNPLPGLHPTHSDLPVIATQAGLPYDDLLNRIVSSAAERLPSPVS